MVRFGSVLKFSFKPLEPRACVPIELFFWSMQLIFVFFHYLFAMCTTFFLDIRGYLNPTRSWHLSMGDTPVAPKILTKRGIELEIGVKVVAKWVTEVIGSLVNAILPISDKNRAGECWKMNYFGSQYLTLLTWVGGKMVALTHAHTYIQLFSLAVLSRNNCFDDVYQGRYGGSSGRASSKRKEASESNFEGGRKVEKITEFGYFTADFFCPLGCELLINY